MKEAMFAFFIGWIISVIAWIVCLIYLIKTDGIVPLIIAMLIVQVFGIGVYVTRLFYQI